MKALPSERGALSRRARSPILGIPRPGLGTLHLDPRSTHLLSLLLGRSSFSPPAVTAAESRLVQAAERLRDLNLEPKHLKHRYSAFYYSNMVKINQQRLDQALGLLGELFVLRQRSAEHFVVCGGSSLLALELVRRTTTRDVDILARMEAGHLVPAQPLQEWLLADAEDVRAQLNLPPDWLNAVAADESLFRLGFPEGLADRVTTRDYGPRLRISFIGRLDQIFFKLYAAADQAGRHFQDLRELHPTPDELLAAARWTRTQDSSEGFVFALGEIFKALGHEHLIGQL